MTEPHHYDALEGRPDWSKELGRIRAMERQSENETRRRDERRGARHG
jgi:hypothetical protein